MEALIERWYRHGREVHDWYKKLCADPTLTGDAKIIAWFEEYVPADLKQYHFFHDCGKPFCQTIDENGKEHYPNHSEMSAKKYIEMFGSGPVADMILHDMDFHTKRGDDLVNTWRLSFADHLYATAWAEIFANAELFGGRESDSFKIKRKRLIQALKKRC
jgi:hypothetical protein